MMLNLLETILFKLENNNLMFRANAYELWNYGCEDYIVPWGYDQEKLIETLQDVELDDRAGNIQILHEDDVLKHEDLIKQIKESLHEEFVDEVFIANATDDEIIKQFPQQYYCGNHQIMWCLWNEGIECLSDYTTGLDEYFDMNKLYTSWDEEFSLFIKGLS